MKKENANSSQEVKEQAAHAEQSVATEESPKTPTLEQQLDELKQENEKLKEQKGKLEKTVARLQSSADKSDAYLNQLVAMKNDFESYKRRMKFNAEQAKTEGVQSVALKLIAIADTFEIAQKHIADEETLKAFDMIYKQFIDTLHSVGITEMNVKGQPFDHMTMNALSKMDYGAENTDKVVEVYKNGYTMDEKVLRYAEVIVGA